MTTRYSNPLPHDWRTLPAAAPAVLMADIAATKNPRLHAKLIVFPRRKQLRAFWRAIMLNDLCGDTCGCVHDLTYRAILPSGGEVRCVDPRYFAVIGLISTHLTMEIITHESFHAAMAYDRRRNMHRRTRHLDRRFLDLEAEEELAYPVGHIARAIVNALHKGKLLP